MINCKKCKRITKTGEPTGLLRKFRVWFDKDKKEHKDIISSKVVCLNCVEREQ